jgi:hypothetical protein
MGRLDPCPCGPARSGACPVTQEELGQFGIYRDECRLVLDVLVGDAGDLGDLLGDALFGVDQCGESVDLFEALVVDLQAEDLDDLGLFLGKTGWL